jgi:hypothetical protein
VAASVTKAMPAKIVEMFSIGKYSAAPYWPLDTREHFALC